MREIEARFFEDTLEQRGHREEQQGYIQNALKINFRAENQAQVPAEAPS
jgi:hypothetical protein